MKTFKILFTLVFTSLASLLFGQDDLYKHELSLNTTHFVANYFNLGGVASNSPYICDYKYAVNEGFYLRSGFNVLVVNDNIERSDFKRTVSSHKAFDIRLGAEKRKRLADKWVMHYGVDIIGGMDYEVEKYPLEFQDENFQVVDVFIYEGTESHSIGVGPVAGIRWEVSKRISLWTESKLYLDYNNVKTITRWDNVPDDVVTRNPGFFFGSVSQIDYKTRLDFYPPLDIYVTFNF